jgi:hypothetical protein
MKKSMGGDQAEAVARGRRWMRLLGVCLLALFFGGLLFWPWPRPLRDPQPHLKAIRRTVENGRPVVVFRAEIIDSRRITVTDFYRIIGERTEDRRTTAGPRGVRSSCPGKCLGLEAAVDGAYGNSQSTRAVQPDTHPLEDPEEKWGAISQGNLGFSSGMEQFLCLEFPTR